MRMNLGVNSLEPLASPYVHASKGTTVLQRYGSKEFLCGSVNSSIWAENC